VHVSHPADQFLDLPGAKMCPSLSFSQAKCVQATQGYASARQSDSRQVKCTKACGVFAEFMCPKFGVGSSLSIFRVISTLTLISKQEQTPKQQ
jgi:hypothetical protein